MEKQKTAVEWLVEQLGNDLYIKDSSMSKQAITKAKQMEKEQIIEAWLNGYHKCGCKQPKQGSKYYLETYGKHENKAENND